ncbi:hypothetical protein PG993_014962 [Apiospora rasikravindrae]|uniref:Uncharacterized protein n=1 Tax=Apiospora rasikravindrae TaxID=990691 RepID=A0ABR1RRB7_9PEZI
MHDWQSAFTQTQPSKWCFLRDNCRVGLSAHSSLPSLRLGDGDRGAREVLGGRERLDALLDVDLDGAPSELRLGRGFLPAVGLAGGRVVNLRSVGFGFVQALFQVRLDGEGGGRRKSDELDGNGSGELHCANVMRWERWKECW